MSEDKFKEGQKLNNKYNLTLSQMAIIFSEQ